MSTALFTDTIVAPITGFPGAVGIVRLSGTRSYEIASRVFAPWPSEVTALQAQFGRLANGDEGFALPFAEGHSYTGETVVELSVHGSRASVASLVEACVAAGARMALPGEFTQRAFLNGRIDLTQAEAVRETIESETSAQLRCANRNRHGAFRDVVVTLREEVLWLLAQVEASVDFAEEVGDLDRIAFSAGCDGLVKRLDEVLSEGQRVRVAREGVRIALVGLPNSGKSSLLNALLGQSRSIVTEIPGTTRDYVEEVADFGGTRVVLVDTAGLRETSDPVEAIGVQRSRAQALQADEIWYLYDASLGWTPADEETTQSLGECRILANKADLVLTEEGLANSEDSDAIPTGIQPAPGLEGDELDNPGVAFGDSLTPGSCRIKPLRGSWIGTPISAVTGLGLTELVDEVAARGRVDAPYYVNERHGPLLNRALEALTAANRRAQALDPEDLLAVLLRDAYAALGEITGEQASADILEAIFSKFCIGK